jgi:hypothetical protein
MNLSIFLKILQALSVVTERDPNGVTMSAYALSLKQGLEIIAKDAESAQQLDAIIASAVCNDWATFEEVGGFVAACLTQGKAANIPRATGSFQQMAAKVATA